MDHNIPANPFRVAFGFSARPELEIDTGPGNGILVGQNASRDQYNAVFLGKQAETPYKNVWMDVRGAHVLYVMGKRRSGKSYTLGVLAEGLVAKNWVCQGAVDQGVLILDTMNVYLTMPHEVDSLPVTAASRQDALKWKLGAGSVPTRLFHPRGTDIPAGVSSQEVSLRPSELGPEEWCGLFEVDPFADPLGHLMTELHGKVSEDGYTVGDVQVPPNADFTLEQLITALTQDTAFDRYHRDTREALRRRLEVIRRLPVFSDEGLDVRTLVDGGSISVLLLRDIDAQMRSVLVGIIVKRLMQIRGSAEQYERMLPVYRARAQSAVAAGHDNAASYSRLVAECERAAKDSLPRCWIIIDEAHNYIPSRGNPPSRKPLKKYVDEGRNLGLSIVVATQQPSGLDPSIQRNADVLIIHSLTHRDDIRAADGMLNADIPDEVVLSAKQRITGPRTFETLLRSLPQGYAMVSTDRANRLFPLLVRPRLTVHGGAEY